MKRMNFPGRKEQRRKEAEERQQRYNKVDLATKLNNAGPKERKKLEK